MVPVIPIAVVGAVLFLGLRKFWSKARSVIAALLVVAVLLALYKVNGSDWGNVAVVIVDGAIAVVEWLSDQFVSMWEALDERF